MLHQRAPGREVTDLDKAGQAGHPSGMTESPYAIPEEDLIDSARVPMAEQFIEQPERRFFAPDWSSGVILAGDGGDADGQ